MTKVASNELDKNAMGGTELMQLGLEAHVDNELLSKFQFVRSRLRDLDPEKIPILWLHDLPNDPEAMIACRPENFSKFATTIMVSNWQMQMYAAGLGVPYSACNIMKNAIVPFPDDVMSAKPDPKDEIRLIYHSTPHRGLNLLVPVFEALAEEFPNLHLDVYSSFNLYGWGERDEPFREVFNRCDAHPRIHNHGTVSNDEIRKALTRAHIFAFPSTWPETSCICAIEAMSAGVDIVCPNLAALPETTAGLVSMYQYVEDQNTHAHLHYMYLHGAITALLEGRQEMPRIQLMREYANHTYSWERRAQSWSAMLYGIATRHDEIKRQASQP